MTPAILPRPAISENVVDRKSIPNGCIGVCPETREILLGAGIGNEPYRLYIDRARYIDGFTKLVACDHHDENEIVIVIQEKNFWFYQWHANVPVPEPSGVVPGKDIKADVGYWQYYGKVEADLDTTNFLKKPEKFAKDDFLIFGEDGKVISSGKKPSDFALQTSFKSHTGDKDIHVSKTEKETWNAKQAALSEAQMKAVNSGLQKSDKEKLDKISLEQLAKAIYGLRDNGVEIPVDANHVVDIHTHKRFEEIPVVGKPGSVTDAFASAKDSFANIIGSRVYDRSDVRWKVQSYTVELWDLMPQEPTGSYMKWYECAPIIPENKLILRKFHDGDFDYWQLVYNGVILSQTSEDISEAGEWIFETPVVFAGYTLTKLVSDEIYVDYKNIDVRFPPAVAGHSRDFFLNLRPVLDDVVYRMVPALPDTVINPFDKPLSYEDLPAGYYHVIEVYPHVLMVDHVDSNWIIEYIKSLGTVSNPFKGPLCIEQGGVTYKLEIYDDDHGIGLDIKRA